MYQQLNIRLDDRIKQAFCWNERINQRMIAEDLRNWQMRYEYA